MTHAGRVIAGRYELVSPLGEGGMGVVWRARDSRLGRTVAVKLLAAAALGSDLARKRLVREAQAAAALEHEGIIRVYDVGETDDGGAFLVMELVRGRSFRAEMLADPASLTRIVAVTAQAARALHVAHQAGIIHRDVKPDNIMIRDSGAVIVVDFGVAKPVSTELAVNAETAAGALETSLTGEGQLIGTPAYLSPEQARGHEVTAATDQFALAVTAYEAMTGRLPWKGSGVLDIVASILRDEPQPLTELVPSAPDALEHALERALSKTPADRWEHLEAFADALEAAALDLPAGPAPALRSASGPGGGAGATTDVMVPPRRRALVTVLGALALGLGLVSVWLSLRAREPAGAPVVVVPGQTPRVACPPFVVTGVDEPWLGAAAAILACERLALVHGGLDAVAIGPPELAGASRELRSDLPVLYESADERDGAVRAAKRADTWLDGSLERQPSGYMARITVRTPDGAELSRGEGESMEMFEGRPRGAPAAAGGVGCPGDRALAGVARRTVGGRRAGSPGHAHRGADRGPGLAQGSVQGGRGAQRPRPARPLPGTFDVRQEAAHRQDRRAATAHRRVDARRAHHHLARPGYRRRPGRRAAAGGAPGSGARACLEQRGEGAALGGRGGALQLHRRRAGAPRLARGDPGQPQGRRLAHLGLASAGVLLGSRRDPSSAHWPPGRAGSPSPSRRARPAVSPPVRSGTSSSPGGVTSSASAGSTPTSTARSCSAVAAWRRRAASPTPPTTPC